LIPQSGDYTFWVAAPLETTVPAKNPTVSPSDPSKVAAFRRQIFQILTCIVCCLKEPWTDTNGTFHDADLSQMASEAWMIRHHPVYHKNDDSVAVKTLKPRKKWNHRQIKVSISSHITTIPATLPTFQQTLDKERKVEGQTGAYHSMWFSTALPVNYEHYSESTSCEFHNNYILQPSTGFLDFIYQRVSPWSNLSTLQNLQRGQDKISTRIVSHYLNQSHDPTSSTSFHLVS
jgi:hypothetical protein